MREFVKRIHFVGIGGIGMSGIAEVLLDLGFSVSGSDLQANATTARLGRAGASIALGHAAPNIGAADVVVTSSAIDADNPEVCAARAQKIPLIPRAEMLGELMRFRKGIAVAGTHGKTTTTSLIAEVLTRAQLHPTFIIGGVVSSLSTNARLGQGDYLVAEADESDASFLHLQPQLAVVTNIDSDHMETYNGDFAKLVDTYTAFLHNLPFYGLAVMCVDDPTLKQLAVELPKPVLGYGFCAAADCRAVNVRQQGRCSFFEVVWQTQSLGEFQLALPGRHNVLNALAAVAIAHQLGVEVADMQAALAGFKGIRRRFESLGRIDAPQGPFELVDDYAHHPTELAATLAAAQACWPTKRVVTVFQPHRYTRTRDLFDDFAQLLGRVDNLLVTEVYAAGEVPLAGSDGRALCRAIRRRGKDPIFIASFAELRATLRESMLADDVLLTLGAGDIGRFARELAARGSL